MKNKICISKKILQFFGILFLIIGFFILTNFINKTISPNQNALATYSCSAPNQEVMRTSNQMCFLVCGSHGGYLRQDFNTLKCCCKGNTIAPTPTTSIIKIPTQLTPTSTPKPIQNQNPRCTFNPSKTCSPGSKWMEYNGFCGCLINKRCMSETSQLYDTPNHYLSWIEEYKDDKWQMFQTCLYPEPICDTNTFRCVSMGPTGPKKFGEVCQTSSECQSGECDSQYTSPSGDEIILIRKQCTYSLIDQGKFANKKRDTDLKLSAAAAALVVATVTSPLIAEIYPIAATAGTSYAASRLLVELQQPWAQNTMATINLTSTLYAISDCAQNGTNGEWCNMLAAMASGNPGQFGQILGNDLKTISGNISRLPNIGKYFNLQVESRQNLINQADSLINDNAQTIIPYQPVNISKATKDNWPVGRVFPTDRGGTVSVDEMIGQGSFGYVYKATVYTPGYKPKTVVMKMPIKLNPAELVNLQSEYYVLSNGQKILRPSNSGTSLAKGYGFAKVNTSLGEINLPLLGDFGEGTTLSRLIRFNPPKPVILYRAKVDKLYQTAQYLDQNGIYLRDVMSNNLWVTEKGELIFFDPFIPRLNEGTGNLIASTMRKFTREDIFQFRLNKNVLEQIVLKGGGTGWIYDVPTGNVAALNKMFELYNNMIIIK